MTGLLVTFILRRPCVCPPMHDRVFSVATPWVSIPTAAGLSIFMLQGPAVIIIVAPMSMVAMIIDIIVVASGAVLLSIATGTIIVIAPHMCVVAMVVIPPRPTWLVVVLLLLLRAVSGLVVLVSLPLSWTVALALLSSPLIICYNTRIVLSLWAFGQWRWDTLKTSVDAALVPSSPTNKVATMRGVYAECCGPICDWCVPFVWRRVWPCPRAWLGHVAGSRKTPLFLTAALSPCLLVVRCVAGCSGIPLASDPMDWIIVWCSIFGGPSFKLLFVWLSHGVPPFARQFSAAALSRSDSCANGALPSGWLGTLPFWAFRWCSEIEGDSQVCVHSSFVSEDHQSWSHPAADPVDEDIGFAFPCATLLAVAGWADANPHHPWCWMLMAAAKEAAIATTSAKIPTAFFIIIQGRRLLPTALDRVWLGRCV